ncbi:MAG: hypothetical protein JSW58_07195 [Candidatus Latescibacterota bacterium]|nr:MAG: hypothetical protein JSW58_07195 [Candidatus Latescibacterota bacterium]
MKHLVAFVCVLLVALLLLTAEILATQIEYVSPKQMGTESSLVVRGKVVDVRSFWNEGHTKILTETVVNVDEAYKGQAVPSVRILQLGGVVGTLRMHVHGALSWRSGEEVLLFLEPLETGQHRVSGFSQGKFMIERDPVTGEPFIRRPALEGAEVLGAPSRDKDPLISQTTKLPLDDFVKEALGRQ